MIIVRPLVAEYRVSMQVRDLGEGSGQRARLQVQLQECEQILRTGPGGDIRSYLQRKKRALILAMLLGDKVPLKASVCSPTVHPNTRAQESCSMSSCTLQATVKRL